MRRVYLDQKKARHGMSLNDQVLQARAEAETLFAKWREAQDTSDEGDDCAERLDERKAA